MTVLIMTIGGLGVPKISEDGRPSIVDTLVSAVSDVRPRPHRVVLLHSKDSAPIAEIVALRLMDEDYETSLELLSDHENVVGVYRDVTGLLRRIRREGIVPAEIAIEYTSGTKPMSAGLVMAALDAGCRSFRYVGGGRQGGLVEHGLAEFLEVNPRSIRKSRDVQLAIDLLRDLQFEAVKRTLPGGAAADLDEYERHVLENARSLASAFDCWDKFRHGDFPGHFAKVTPSLPELDPFNLERVDPERVARMHIDDGDSSVDGGGRRFSARHLSLDHLADLWNNADRRFRLERFDDAVARLYRLTEMIGQFVLIDRFGVDAGGVRLDDVKAEARERVRVWLLARGDRSDDVWLDLQGDYSLLRTLGDPIGEVLDRSGVLNRRVQKRNASILAHGITPITAADARALRSEVRSLALQVDRLFDQRCRELEFPWLVDPATSSA